MGYTLIIDNYDSFTWNVYADVAVLGGNPLVMRNDKITIPDIQNMFDAGDLDRVIISPGPGHPTTDSGISRDVISWGIGKIPILGVCMGLECLVDVLGGEIAYAGEIKHGKTSLVEHDAMGCFFDLPPLLNSTRYHSLSANLLSLPPSLQVTATTQDSGVIMAVRHREACVEAVQYHPESCMSEGGRGMMANFLKMKGGHWGGENAWCGVQPSASASGSSSEPKANGSAPIESASPKLPTILNRIHAQRLLDVESASAIPATTPANISKSISLHTCPPLISFVDRIKSTPHTAIMAEIKRASPSKGDIAPDASAPEQGIKYALAGASVISVLTEPKWFKGSLVDMLAVRNAVSSLPNRPAILRKDFIVSTYQIDEARLYGADTVLLIVAMLDPPLLKELYDYSVSIGMEPLVEVNNPSELNTALDLGSKVIGVNNRNLHDFNVDMSTTSRVNAALQGRDVILCALSGISQPSDVEGYVKEGVKAVLVGESLMRAEDPKAFLRSLVGLPIPPAAAAAAAKPLVKICGVRSVKDAQAAIEAGADLIGVILLQGVKRSITHALAKEIAGVVRLARDSAPSAPASKASGAWFSHHATRLASRRKPLLVGVFRNQPLSEILDAVDATGIDLVQLHGTEPQEWANFIPVPVIKTFSVNSEGKVSGGQLTRSGLNQFILLDAAASTASAASGTNGASGASGVGTNGGEAVAGGGEGKSFPWKYAKQCIDSGESGNPDDKLPVLLAGGLHPGNVAEAIEAAGSVVAVDVSSGVEGEDGWKDLDKVQRFIKAVKG